MRRRLFHSSSTLGDDFASLGQALDRFEAKREIDHSFLGLIERCGAIGDLSLGRRIQRLLSELGDLDRDRYFGNVLVRLFGRCGSVDDAKRVFDGISRKNVYSWNLLIAAYTGNGHLSGARAQFNLMKTKDSASYHTMISAYGNTGDCDEAERLFDSMPERSVISWNTLLRAFARSRDLLLVERFFDKFPQKDVVTWNTLMAAFLRGSSEDRLKILFDRVPERSIVSWSALCAAYAQKGYSQLAKEVFDRLPKRSIVCWTSMVTALARDGQLEEARTLFDSMPDRDDMAWSTMIAAYAQNDRMTSAKDLLGMSPEQSKRPWTVMMSAHIRNGELEQAVKLFRQMPNPDMVAWTAMLGAFAQLGRLHESRKMFESMTNRDLVAWTSIIAAHVQYGRVGEALELFGLMDLEGVAADRVTLISILDSCLGRGCIAEGKIIHSSIAGSDLETDVAVGTALFNLYARSAKVGEARSIFDKLQSRDVVSWTAMIVAYAQNGHTAESLELFCEMVLEGLPPNEVTMMGILAACSHAGLLDDGYQHFLAMSCDFAIAEPGCEHYVCMVDLLGRSGRVSEAEELLKTMPFEANEVAWMSLLGACKLHKDLDRAARVSKECEYLKADLKIVARKGGGGSDKDFPLASFVLLSNIFVESERTEL